MTEPDKNLDPLATIQMDNPITKSHVFILEKLASTLELEEVFKRIVEAAVHLSRADEGSLWLRDEETGELGMRAAKGFGDDYASVFRQKMDDDSLVTQVIKTGRPILIGPDTGLKDQVKVKTGYFARSVLNLPIKRGNIIHGVLAVYNSGSHRAFTHHHLALLTPLANYAGIAIENARRFQEANDLLNEAYRLVELLELTDYADYDSDTFELDDLLYFIASNAQGRLKPADNRVVVHLLNPETNQLDPRARIPHIKDEVEPAQRVGLNESIAGLSLLENCIQNIPDIKKEPLFDPHSNLSGSLLVAPMAWRNLRIGTISIASSSENAFKRRDERFLSILARWAGIAIENSRQYFQQTQLYKESQERLEAVERRNRELNSLRDVLGALQSTLSLPEVLGRIANGVLLGLNYRAVMLSTVDEPNRLLTVQEFALEPGLHDLLMQGEDLAGQRLVGNSASLEHHRENIGIQVCLDGQARVTHSLSEIFRPVLEPDMCALFQKLFELTTLAVMPIRSESQLFGVLYAGTQREEVAKADLEALQAFAHQAALAIQNARQFEHIHERLRRRVRELHELQDIDRSISSISDLERLLHHLLEVGLKLVNADSGNIVLADRDTGVLTPKVSYPVGCITLDKYKPGLTAWVAQERKTARIKDLTQTNWLDLTRQPAVYSELAAPILLGEELVGVINMGSSSLDAFTEEDESLLDILATQAAVAIQTARYYQELEESRLRSIEAERVAAMGDIASNMVHSINNSTGAIRVLVQQIRHKLAQGVLTEDFLTGKLDAIEVSAEKTLAMARSIRDPFKPMAAELIEVNACIETALQNLEPIAPGVELILNLTPELPPVKVTQQLIEVFSNLIKNAIEAMEGRGILTICSRQFEHTVEVAVSDSGPGLPPQLTVDNIFKLGTSSKKGGLGYGLWWCKIFLNRFGGMIQLEPGIGTGCKFLVRLPFERGPHWVN